MLSVSNNDKWKSSLITENVNKGHRAVMHAGHYHMNVPGTHVGGKDLIKPNSSLLRMSREGFEYCSQCSGLGTVGRLSGTR
jgi:hypothetical protein